MIQESDANTPPPVGTINIDQSTYKRLTMTGSDICWLQKRVILGVQSEGGKQDGRAQAANNARSHHPHSPDDK